MTSPVVPSSIDDEETHDPTSTRFAGHWRCTCGYVGSFSESAPFAAMSAFLAEALAS